MNLGIPMVRRKKFRKCVLKEMGYGSTRKNATMKCRKDIKQKEKKLKK